MPQGNLFTNKDVQYSMSLTYREDASRPDFPATLSYVVRNGQEVVLVAGTVQLPPVWGPQAYADCAKAAVEAYDLSGAPAIELAIRRVAREWRKQADALLSER